MTDEGQILDPPAEPVAEGTTPAAEPASPEPPAPDPRDQRLSELARENQTMREQFATLFAQMQVQRQAPAAAPASTDPNDQWWTTYVQGKSQPQIQQAVAPVATAAQQALLIASRAEAKEEMDEEYGDGAYRAYRKDVEAAQMQLAAQGHLLHARDIFKYVVGNDGGKRLPKAKEGVRAATQAQRTRAAANATTENAAPVGRPSATAKAVEKMSLDDMIREWGDMPF